MTTAIIDYGSGNLCSAAKAFERAAAGEGLQGAIVVTSRPGAYTGEAQLPGFDHARIEPLEDEAIGMGEELGGQPAVAAAGSAAARRGDPRAARRAFAR